MDLVTGNTQGLKPSQKKLLERISRRRVDPGQVVSPELAAFLCECSREVDRQVGALVDRRGNVTHVIVGDAHKLMLPDLGRFRAGASRFRGLRLLHTHLRSEPLTHDDLVDLAKLRLDLVAAIGMRPDGSPGTIACAHLLPENPEQQLWRELPPMQVTPQALDKLDFDGLIRSLEAEFAQKALSDIGKMLAGQLSVFSNAPISLKLDADDMVIMPQADLKQHFLQYADDLEAGIEAGARALKNALQIKLRRMRTVPGAKQLPRGVLERMSHLGWDVIDGAPRGPKALVGKIMDKFRR